MKSRRDPDGWPTPPVLTPDPAERHYPDEDASIRDVPADRYYVDEWRVHPVHWVMAGMIGGVVGSVGAVVLTWWWLTMGAP